MNIKSIILEMGIDTFISCTEVLEGADSSVWKIDLSDGSTNALRILPSERFGQFIREEKMINFVIKAGIPVPKVYCVKIVGDFAVMLMEWAHGKPVLHELMENPKAAFKIGVNFGRVQAAIHKVIVPESYNEKHNWLTPESVQEQEIIDLLKVNYTYTYNALVHLDYHPLNVLADGETITAVIDWVNATAGDPRMDIARTFSILQIDGKTLGEEDKRLSEAIEDFEEGWIEGYSQIAGPLTLEPLFNVWAGIRMERDLAGKRGNEVFVKIRKWMDTWK